MFADISWVAAALCVVAATVVGGLWYSPLMAGKAWMAELGKTPQQLGNPIQAMITAMAMNLIAAVVMQKVIAWRGAEGLGAALTTSFVVWLGFAGAMQLMQDRFHGRSIKLSAINAVNTLASYLAMGAVIYFVA